MDTNDIVASYPPEADIQAFTENLEYLHKVLDKLGISRKNRAGVHLSFFMRMCKLQKGLEQWQA